MLNDSLNSVVKFAKVLKKEGIRVNNSCSTDMFEANVLIINPDFKRRNLLQIYVKLDDYNNYSNVNIMWEDKIKNYKEYGLKGYYSTDYTDIDFDESKKELVIEDSLNTIIISKN